MAGVYCGAMNACKDKDTHARPDALARRMLKVGVG
jgi:hypothetical protein